MEQGPDKEATREAGPPGARARARPIPWLGRAMESSAGPQSSGLDREPPLLRRFSCIPCISPL